MARKHKKQQPGYTDAFRRQMPFWAWFIAVLVYILPLLVETRVLVPGNSLPERLWLYAVWLVPGFLISFYLGWVGAALASLSVIPFLAAYLYRLWQVGTEFYLVLSSFLILVLIVLAAIGLLAEKLKRQEEKMLWLSVTDELTGLFNHRFFRQCLEKEVDRARRYHLPLSLVIINLDNFKELKNTWGQFQGGNILAHAAGIIKDTVRTSDFVSRYGGEEFAIILPQTPLNHAKQTCERIREALASSPVPLPSGMTGPLTASFGVVSYEEGMTPVTLVEEADRVLYVAKSAG